MKKLDESLEKITKMGDYFGLNEKSNEQYNKYIIEKVNFQCQIIKAEKYMIIKQFMKIIIIHGLFID